MTDPQPDQIRNYPQVGGEVRYLFRKTLDQNDMWGLPLVGHSTNYFRGLPMPLLETIARSGLELELYTPSCTTWVQMKYELPTRNFRLQKIDWLDAASRSGFRVGDTIDCWALYHAEVGPVGILSLLMQKLNEGAGQ